MTRRYSLECALALASLLLFAASGAFAQTAPPAAPPQKVAPPPAKKKPAPAKPAAPPAPRLDPKAVEILKAVGDKLASAHALSFTATESFESLSRQGDPIVFLNRYEAALRRPDRLRVITTGDGPVSEFYYDGKEMMAYDPAMNIVALAQAPPTIDAMLEMAYHKAGIYYPFTDLIVGNPYTDLAPSMQLAYYIGQSQIVGDTTTDIVAVIAEGVFMQIWVGSQDKLPRMIHAVYLEDPARLRHNLMLSNWQLEPPVTDDSFTTTKASGAKRMEFAHPHPESEETPAPAPKPKAPAKPKSPAPATKP